jgi:hypothetical protein
LTTERYLGCKQNLEEPVNDRVGSLSALSNVEMREAPNASTHLRGQETRSVQGDSPLQSDAEICQPVSFTFAPTTLFARIPSRCGLQGKTRPWF